MTVAAPSLVVSPAGLVRYEALSVGRDRVDASPFPRAVWMTGEFGCLEACIATMLDVDVAQVPAGPGGEHSKVAELEHTEHVHAWVRSRGCRMRYREISPELWAGWWIGVSVDPRPGYTHTVVCCGRALVFDPALAVPVPEGCAVAPVDALHYAITIDPVEG